MTLKQSRWALALLACMGATASTAQTADRLQVTDLYRMKSVGEAQFSPDRARIAYTVSNNDGQGRPYSQLWIMELSSGKSMRVSDDKGRGSQPTWSPDGSRIAFSGKLG